MREPTRPLLGAGSRGGRTPAMESAPEVQPERRLLTAELAALLGVHPKTILRWRRLGLPSVRPAGGVRLYLPSEVTRWLDGRGGTTT